MQSWQRVELTCAAVDYDFWLTWLLQQHQGSLDVIAVRRYGLNHTQLSRSEQVKGFADYYRFSLMLPSEAAIELKQMVSQQAHPIEVCLLNING